MSYPHKRVYTDTTFILPKIVQITEKYELSNTRNSLYQNKPYQKQRLLKLKLLIHRRTQIRHRRQERPHC